MFDRLRMRFAELVAPKGRALSTLKWIAPSGTKKKTVLPRNPEARHLRNLSRDPIVRRAITIVQSTLARQPYNIEVIGGRGKATKQVQAVRNVIEHPNVVDTRESFTKRCIDDSMVLDAMVVEVAKAEDSNHPIYLYPIDSSTIQHLVPVCYDQPNAPRYAQQQPDGMKYFTAKEMAYIQRDYFTYQPYGLSPVRMAYDYIRYYLEAMEQTNRRATNATASYIIGLEDVSEEEHERFIQYFEEEIEGTGKIPVVAGTKIETRQIRPASEDMSYLKWQEMLTRIVATAFNIPCEKLGLMIANDRSTGEDQETAMASELIAPYASMMEDFYNKYVIEAMGLGGVLKFSYVHEETERQKTMKSKRVLDEYYKDAITENEFRSTMGYALSYSKYANMTHSEKTANINVDCGIAGGFNGVGGLKDTSDIKDDKPSEQEDST